MKEPPPVDDAKRILYVQTSGTESPERSATVFFLAASAAARKKTVALLSGLSTPLVWT